jgi:hypothetical protein
LTGGEPLLSGDIVSIDALHAPSMGSRFFIRASILLLLTAAM